MSDLPQAPRNREQQMAFLKAQHKNGSDWHNLCQSLARQAPGLPAVAPSAHAAMLMVDPEDRVQMVRNLRRGMVGFFANFTDDNPFDHVATVAGWLTPEPTDSLDDVIFWSPDTRGDGTVNLARGSFFPAQWGDPFQFGSRTLNGFYLPGYSPAPAHDGAPVSKLPTLRETLDRTEAVLIRGRRAQRARGHKRKVAALTRDLEELRQTRDALVGNQ